MSRLQILQSWWKRSPLAAVVRSVCVYALLLVSVASAGELMSRVSKMAPADTADTADTADADAPPPPSAGAQHPRAKGGWVGTPASRGVHPTSSDEATF